MTRDKMQASRHLIKAIDPCLPPAFRDNTYLNLEGLIRARVLVAIMVSAIAATAFTAFVFSIAHLVTGDDFTNPVVIAIICCIAVLLDYLFFFKSGRLDASAILFSLTFFIACITTITLTGGYDSPVRVMLICMPVVAFLVGGRQEGIYNAVLAFVAGIVLLIFRALDFPIVQIMPEAILPYVSGIVWFFSLVLIVVCLYVYDVLLEDTRGTIVHVDPEDRSIENKN